MPISTILIATDLSAVLPVQLDAALRLSEVLPVKRVHAVFVQLPQPSWLDPGSFISAELAATMLRDSALAHLDTSIASKPQRVQITREVRVGRPVQELVEVARAIAADLLIVGTQDRPALERLFLGNTANALVRAAPCPTLFVSERHPFQLPRQILAAVDLSPVSAPVVEYAAELASGAGEGRVEVLSSSDLTWITPVWIGAPPVVLDERERRLLVESQMVAVERLVGPARSRAPGVNLSTRVVPDHPPWRAIVERAKATRADLIVLGASGHNAWERFFMGSTATKVVQHAPCPILVVPVSLAPESMAPESAAPRAS